MKRGPIFSFLGRHVGGLTDQILKNNGVLPLKISRFTLKRIFVPLNKNGGQFVSGVLSFADQVKLLLIERQ